MVMKFLLVNIYHMLRLQKIKTFFEFCGKTGKCAGTYVLSGRDKKTASDENNHSGLGGSKTIIGNDCFNAEY